MAERAIAGQFMDCHQTEDIKWEKIKSMTLEEPPPPKQDQFHQKPRATAASQHHSHQKHGGN